ncbi:prenyltransferase [Candidatus Saccharibacteria bacterium]|nr:prenyltransferase [Candidatus Saccharibacteria bacterium]
MKEKIKQLVISSRPISWVNTAYPFALAYFLTLGSVDTVLIIGTLYFLFPYNALMYGINDVFDYESDILNPRKGGVEGAKLKKKYHSFVIKGAVLLNLPFLIFLILQGSLQSSLVLTFVVFMVVAYSAKGLRFKEKAFLDSVTSSIHFVGPAVYALSLTGWQDAYTPYVFAFFLWGMASHAFGAVQDILFDKEAGIGSIATVIGARWTVRLSVLLYALSGVLLVSQGPLTAPIGFCNILYIISIAPYLSIKDTDSASTNAGWKRFIWLNWFTGFVITIVTILSLL